MICITSYRAGFRRCGVAHPAETTTYPDDFFSAEQMKQLHAEPMLQVEVEDEKPPAPKRRAPKKRTAKKAVTRKKVVSEWP